MNNMIVSMRIPGKLAERLDVFAKGHDRSRSYVIKKALENYLDEYLPHIPNENTARVLNDGNKGKRMKKFDNIKDLMKDLTT